MDYKLIISNGHYLTTIEGENYIVDTGSPESFRFDLVDIKVNGETFKSGNLALTVHHVSKEDTDKLVGLPVAGFIGNDIITRFGGIIFDKDKATVEFTECSARDGENIVQLEDFGVAPIIYKIMPVKINGTSTNVIFDTGAWVGYFTNNVTSGLVQKGKIKDYAPTTGGYIEAPAYEVELEVGGKKLETQIGGAEGSLSLQIMSLSMFGLECSGVMGVDAFVDHRLAMDAKNNQLIFS